jgi:hypothetical protein
MLSAFAVFFASVSVVFLDPNGQKLREEQEVRNSTKSRAIHLRITGYVIHRVFEMSKPLGRRSRATEALGHGGGGGN